MTGGAGFRSFVAVPPAPDDTRDLGRCPFCPGKIYGSIDECVVLHTLPTCERYDQTEDALEFIVAVRQACERKVPRA